MLRVIVRPTGPRTIKLTVHQSLHQHPSSQKGHSLLERSRRVELNTHRRFGYFPATCVRSKRHCKCVTYLLLDVVYVSNIQGLFRSVPDRRSLVFGCCCRFSMSTMTTFASSIGRQPIVLQSFDFPLKCELNSDGILPFDVAIAVQRLGLINSIVTDVNSVF